ncbi:phosphotransferase [Streptomyces sp. NPDC051320]|uniref:phosphotransferase n=1 Tax=Streptomyces sp. NPDC051320 TaxID=3154644 RepID=UPI00341BC0F3
MAPRRRRGGRGRNLLCVPVFTRGTHPLAEAHARPRYRHRGGRRTAAWAGSASVVGLLDHDLSVGALLLAGIEPGARVKESGWRLRDAGALIAELRTAPYRSAPDLRPLADRITILYGMAARRGGRAPEALDRGLRAALETARSGPAQGLVHGDLHPANVLLGPGGPLVAIDLRPTLGDPDYDAVD